MIPAFDSFAVAFASVPSTPGAWSELLLIAASGGVVGMGLSDITSGLTDRFSGGGGEQSPAGDDDFLDDAGDLGEGFGDDLGGDEFGDLDDWDEDDDLDDFGDGGDGLGDGGGGQSDLDPRIEELENEVASISSTMGTVRSENEAIQESVEEIEDNIRKLLEIYEMVTRGVNPFVDEPQGGGGMGGSFGLFDDAGDDGGFDDLDPDVADADPDSFFDDDFDDGSFEDDIDDDDFAEDAVEEDPFGDGALEGDGPEDTDELDDGGGGEGKTFDELKSEYQSGDAEWEDGDDAAEAPVEPAESEDVGAEPSAEESETRGSEGGSESGESAGPDTTTADVAADDTTDQSPPDEPSGGNDADDESSGGGDSRDGKPYLETLPSGYGVELLVIEWLTYLRSQSSTSEALRAIKYYETIGWIGDPAANSLQRYLSGLTGEEVAPSSGGGTQLTIDHHTNSLHYIGKLGGTDVDVERLEWSGPTRSRSRVERRGQRGIQR